MEVGSADERSVGVASVVPPDSVPPIDAVGLSRARPLEIFVAFADPKAQIPKVLIDLYANQPERAPYRQQGWAREKFKEFKADTPHSADATDLACNSDWFEEWVREWQMFYYQTQIRRFDQDSSISGLWTYKCDYSIPTTSCSSCSNATRRRYTLTAIDVDAFQTHVCTRSTGPHNYICPLGSGELLARLLFRYRTTGSNTWRTAWSGSIPPDGANRLYFWYWIPEGICIPDPNPLVDPCASGNVHVFDDYDWRTEIVNAVTGNDYWDIYAAWRSGDFD